MKIFIDYQKFLNESHFALVLFIVDLNLLDLKFEITLIIHFEIEVSDIKAKIFILFDLFILDDLIAIAIENLVFVELILKGRGVLEIFFQKIF